MAYWFILYVLAGQDAAVPAQHNGWLLQPPPPPLFLRAASPPAPAAAVARWLTDLGDDDFETRERAEEALAGQGRPVLARLRHAAATSPDPEVRRRAGAVLLANAGAYHHPEECPSIFQLVGTNSPHPWQLPTAGAAAHAWRWLGVRDRAMTEMPAGFRQPAYHLSLVAGYYHLRALRQFGYRTWTYPADAERFACHLFFSDLADGGVNPAFVEWLKGDMRRRTNPVMHPATQPPPWVLEALLWHP